MSLRKITSVIALVMILLVPVFALSNSPPVIEKTKTLIVVDQIGSADMLVVKYQLHPIQFDDHNLKIVSHATFEPGTENYLVGFIYKRNELLLTRFNKPRFFRKARDALTA